MSARAPSSKTACNKPSASKAKKELRSAPKPSAEEIQAALIASFDPAEISLAGLKSAARALANQDGPIDPKTALAIIPALKRHGQLDRPIFGSDTLLGLICQTRVQPGEAAALGLIRDVVALGASPNAPSQYGQSPLMQTLHGVRHGGVAPQAAHERMKALVEAGADIHHRNQVSQQALTWALWERDCMPISRWLLSLGANPSPAETDGFTPLHHAAKMGDMEAVRLLIDSGADLFALAQDQGKPATPLQVAVTWIGFHRDTGVLELLAGAMAATLERQALEKALPSQSAPKARRAKASGAASDSPAAAAKPPKPKRSAPRGL